MALHYSGGHYRDESGRFVSEDRARHSSIAREEYASYQRELKDYERVMSEAAREEKETIEARATADRDFARDVFGDEGGGGYDYPTRPREETREVFDDLSEFFEQEHEDIDLDVDFDLWDAYDYWDEIDDEDTDEGKSP